MVMVQVDDIALMGGITLSVDDVAVVGGVRRDRLLR